MGHWGISAGGRLDHLYSLEMAVSVKAKTPSVKAGTASVKANAATVKAGTASVKANAASVKDKTPRVKQRPPSRLGQPDYPFRRRCAFLAFAAFLLRAS